ncbi:MAG: amino acid decarboxylase [Bacillota bacterium]|nr:amino acid decarboxylase [Bacillota bacterium]
MNTPICAFIEKYAEKEMTRFHMPGHKGISFLGCEKTDITEIGGADELYAADGIIAESEENAGRLFGFGRTMYSTEGSSQCIRAMLFLALQEAEQGAERPVVLAARNAHKAFLYSCGLLDVDVEWLMPEADGSLCSCPITAAQLEKHLLTMERKPFAVYITAPDYLGYSPDIRRLAEVCKKREIPLLVDHAHGAYLKFLQPSCHAMDLGAAMCCDSAHKTLPVLTGGAYLHLSAEWAEKAGERAKKAMELFGSTSPSYLILQSLDRCNRYLSEGYEIRLEKTIGQLSAVKEKLRMLGWEVMESDPLKLTIFTGAMGYSGRETAETLRKGGIECEFADMDGVVLMATPENSPADFTRILSVLSGLPKREAVGRTEYLPQLPQRRMTIREALFGRWEKVSVREAVGRICASPCVSCPPAIPIAASGEEITEEMASLFLAYGIETIEVTAKGCI